MHGGLQNLRKSPMPFDVLSGVSDVITHAKFYLNRLRVFSAAAPRKWPFPISFRTKKDRWSRLKEYQDCRVQTVQCRLGLMLWSQWSTWNVMLEQAVSGRFSLLPAPFPLRDLPLRSPITISRSIVSFSAIYAPRSAPPDFRPSQLRFPLRSRSAHMLWWRVNWEKTERSKPEITWAQAVQWMNRRGRLADRLRGRGARSRGRECERSGGRGHRNRVELWVVIVLLTLRSHSQYR